MKSSFNAERQSAPTGATESENQEGADRPLGDAACSLYDFSCEVMTRLVKDFDDTLCATGYARFTEVKDEREGHKSFKLDFGHFSILVWFDRENPKPRSLAFAGGSHECEPEEFLRRLNEGLKKCHRPHERGSEIREKFTQHVRGVRNIYREHIPSPQ